LIVDRQKNNLIYYELSEDERVNWFDLKDKKFLHNIDTFYYSIKLTNDFTADSTDKHCLQLRKFFSESIDRSQYNAIVPLSLPGVDAQLNLRTSHYAFFYNINIECPELFDIFIADTVPKGKEDSESVTSEIIVQLRSTLLWQYGCTKAYEYSYEIVKQLIDYFGLSIQEVKENRVDYCWHSNYLQNPEKFFRIDNMTKMRVTSFKRIRYDYAWKANDEYENDYISMGKRGEFCFLRIYLKSKEVVEKGYKGWFLKEWLLNGLISRYDFYVYELAYTKRSWKYVDMARLDFYANYGSNQELREKCAAIVNGSETHGDDFIAKLADELTPRVTLITNVEFQTMRKMSKSFELKFFRDNEDKGVERRIYDYLDNRNMITEYLTHSTFRLVELEGDSNKSRRDYCAFWKALRSCRIVDVKKSPKNLKLIRDYTRNLNKNIIKSRMVNAAITYSIYDKGINQDDVLQDAADVLLMLNDNDVYNLKRQKEKKLLQLNHLLYQAPLDVDRQRRLTLIDNDTGEVL
jgi:hypothetical protein